MYSPYLKIGFLSLIAVIALTSLPPAKSYDDQANSVFPTELVKFKAYQQNPVFQGAGEGHWDQKIRERGWIRKEGKLWKMWYTGYTEPRGNGILKLGYATSKDGINWKRFPKNPIYGDHWVEDMMIIKQDGTYYMFAEGFKDRAHLLESTDGIHWKRIGPLDVRRKNGQPIADGPYGTPCVWLENGIWHLFYERRDLGVWLATSKDRKVWTNVQDEPVMSPGPDDYDKDLIAWNQIIKHKNRYYVYYHGNKRTGPNAKNWTTNIATSTDLIHWEKYSGNPLLPTESNKSSGILVWDGLRYRLYTMHPAVNLHFSQKDEGK